MKKNILLLSSVGTCVGFLIFFQVALAQTIVDLSQFPGRSYIDTIKVIETAGDYNGDGVYDLVVGTSVIKIFQGSKQLLDQLNSGTPDLSLALPEHLELVNLASPGDINQDGFDDLVIILESDYSYSEEDPQAGRSVYVLYGSTDGITDQLSLINYQLLDNDFDIDIQSSRGDLNTDGIDDLVLSAPSKNCSEENWWCGAVYVFFGQTSVFSLEDLNSPDVVISGTYERQYLGKEVRFDGDIDGDNINDLVVLDENKVDGNYGMSSVRVFYGRTEWNSSYQPSEASVILNGGQDIFDLSSISTGSLSIHGDINGDGYDDILLGIDIDDYELGSTFVFFGGPSLTQAGSLAEADVRITRNYWPEYDGHMVRSGDLNGDGIDDVMTYAFDSFYEGYLTVIYGSTEWDEKIDESAGAVQWVVDDGEYNDDIYNFLGSYTDIDDDGSADVVIGGMTSLKSIKRKSIFISSRDQDSDGFSGLEGDCEDSNQDVYPGAPDDSLDYTDGDCDGEVDEDYVYSVQENGLIQSVQQIKDGNLKVRYADGNHQIFELWYTWQNKQSLADLTYNKQRIVTSYPRTGSTIELLDGYTGEVIDSISKIRDSEPKQVHQNRFIYLGKDYALVSTYRKTDQEIKLTLFKVETDSLEEINTIEIHATVTKFSLIREINSFAVKHGDQLVGRFFINQAGLLEVR